ncbi:hypothetical protein HYW31_02355 [Candidatus Berkelbacteria bacterium]|nr:hypothetical protein [Candidatus Berkelbacteria bacterium]
MFTHYIRLALKNRVSERFLTVQVKLPPSPEKNDYGELFCLVEIQVPWQSSVQIGQSIINTLSREYYQAISTSDLENFETAILKVNESLGQLSKLGETEWIGKLNALLCLVNQSEIHLTFSGRVTAFLLRNNKLSSIREEATLESAPPHPLHTFQSLVSGSIEKTDRLIFGNGPETELKNALVFLEENPSISLLEIASSLARSISKEKEKTRFNGLVLELTENPPDANQQNVVYLDEPIISLGSLNQKISKLSQKIKPRLNFFSQKISQKTRENAFPWAKEYFWPTFQNELKLAGQAAISLINFLYRQSAFWGNRLFKFLAFKITAQKEKEPFSVHDYTAPGPKTKTTPPKVSLIVPKLPALKIPRLPWHPIILILVSVLVIVLVVSTLRRKVRSSREIPTGETLRQAEVKRDEAKLALLYNEPSKAIELFGQALKTAEQIRQNTGKNKDLGKEATNLMTQINVDLDKLTDTTRLENPTLLTILKNEADRIFVAEGKVYSLNKKSGEVFMTNPVDGQTDKIKDLPEKRGIYHAAALLGDKNLLLFTTEKQLFNLNLANGEAEIAVLKEGNFENGRELATYVGNVYLLDPSSSQIFRHRSTKEGFQKGENYLVKKVDLTEAVSFTIDGNVYVLKKNGEVLNLLNGEKQEFTLKNLPKPLDEISKPLKIVTDQNSDSLFILDGSLNRVIEFDKKGEFIRQYVLKENQTITDLTINSVVRKMWLLSDKEIFEVGL